MPTDCELLCRYIEKGDQAAFSEVVRRNIDLVYSTALRLVGGDVHRAQDVTQVVFTTLARQARGLSTHASITGWLYMTAKFTACKFVRSEHRRFAREQEATAMQDIAHAPEPNWGLLRPVLDEAVSQLDADDREAVLMRFFQNKSHREVGEILGLSEDSARKRVERALDKMRAHFARLGVTVSAELLATAITSNSVQAAPVGLAESVAGISLAGAGGLATTIGLGTLFMSKTKITIVCIVLVAIIAIIALIYSQRQKTASEDSVPAKIAQAPANNQTPAVRQTPAQVEPPLAPPIQPKPETADPAPAPSAAIVADPQADLKTAIPDIVRLLRAGDNVDLRLNYTPPDELTPKIVAIMKAMPAAMAQNPTAQQVFQQMANEAAEACEVLETETPTFNDTGDEATYPVTTSKLVGKGDGAMIPNVFIKINGKWYLKWNSGSQSN